ncbi:hypothetical protein [Clostridium beijerinckii]|uniref:hypothetical protein n=1 Tax=Clostridium beijerinckii TaxID=1520 RepID=UPI000685BE49|nr:hypothetical protein [Clostridium beijerinckii]
MNLIFNETYYKSVVEKYKYDPLDFKPINFDFPGINNESLNKKWLCHHEGNIFASGLLENEKSIVTTGIGLSGAPHMGTISQIMRAIFLQNAGLSVQFVLGDLDSYNARNQSLSVLEERAHQYQEFITKLGFDANRGILRTQKQRQDIVLTAYLISNCLKDKDFNNAEEDLVKLYQKMGYYPEMDFPVKQSILLMVADFIHLGMKEDYKNVLVMLGLEEHLYVLLAKKVVSRLNIPMNLGGLYSPIIKGFNGHPKMSKSILGSGITVEMNPDDIRKLIINEKEICENPDDSVVYQMMCSVSYYTAKDLEELSEIYRMGGDMWKKRKVEYADMVIDICEKWPH